MLTHECTAQCPLNVISVFKFKQILLPDTVEPCDFPPSPLNDVLVNKIITDWNEDVKVPEIGCAVCGQLKPHTDMASLKSMNNYLHVLVQPGVSRKERKSNLDPVTELVGPVLDQTCDHICATCRRSLREGKRPRISLANGCWLGSVPKELKDLNFMEKLLVQKMRTNCCFVKVSSGMRKMISHVIAFETPVAKVYD
ncbi:hypothetical protein K435DRAFT_694035, partial [Dendrothele bispora CBS 962.96]